MWNLRQLVVVLAALFVVSCSHVAVDSGSAEVLESTGARTYAWVDGGSLLAEEAAPIGDAAVLTRFREALDRELQDAGYALVPLEEARLEATMDVGVSERVVQNDPYFAFWAYERVESGHLSFAFLHPVDQSVIWSANARRDLRVTERGTGHSDRDSVGTEEQREWRPELMANAVLSNVPRR
ncbi:MAG: hypothetical protein AAF726_10940 [Planctomycetota bacterium]